VSEVKVAEEAPTKNDVAATLDHFSEALPTVPVLVVKGNKSFAPLTALFIKYAFPLLFVTLTFAKVGVS